MMTLKSTAMMTLMTIMSTTHVPALRRVQSVLSNAAESSQSVSRQVSTAGSCVVDSHVPATPAHHYNNEDCHMINQNTKKQNLT